MLKVSLLIISISILLLGERAQSESVELAESLRAELNHSVQRRKNFSEHNKNNKIFDKEREKGLSLFLEEQEKFDILRERGLNEYKNSIRRPLDEQSPEYFADLRAKEKAVKALEQKRQEHVLTRDKILTEYANKNSQTEEGELDLNNLRPRYDLRKRAKNKWVKSGGGASRPSGSGQSNSGIDSGGIPDFSNNNGPDFPPAPEYNPQPIDNFEDIAPPPPPIPYDSSQGPGPGFDSGFGEPPMIPPPPQPDDGWDF